MASKAKRAALYLRVSTDEQTVDNQQAALVAEAERRGWAVVQTYSDAGISGALGRQDRPGLDKALKDATRGRYDVLMVWAVDRLGRSLVDLIGTMQELHSAKVDLFLHQQAIDTTTPFGKAMFQMLGVFAEFERSMIQARVNAGLQRAKETGTRSGKPVGRPKLSEDAEKRVQASLAAGNSIYLTRRLTGVGQTTIERIKREMGAINPLPADPLPADALPTDPLPTDPLPTDARPIGL